MNFYDGRNIEILTKKGANYHGEILFVHDNGWFEVNLKDSPKKRQQRIRNTVNSYTSIRSEYEGLSNIRLDYLKQTINFLKGYGSVCLVRMPVHEEMYTIETDLMPNFDNKIF